jgi:hypothetical protein
MSSQAGSAIEGAEQSHSETAGEAAGEAPGEALEPVPPKSPHRKYLVLLALHMIHTDDPRVFSDATDCSERTFHYVKSRLCKHDGVIISYDRRAGRYIVVHSGVLEINRVAELMKRHYPRRYANIEQLARDSRANFIG